MLAVGEGYLQVTMSQGTRKAFQPVTARATLPTDASSRKAEGTSGDSSSAAMPASLTTSAKKRLQGEGVISRLSRMIDFRQRSRETGQWQRCLLKLHNT